MAEPSRIKVTPAEEEDIVIMAGAVEPVEPADVDIRAVPSTGSDAEPSEPTDDDEAVEATPTPSSKAAYRETTLEDLQTSGAPRMQKAIIAVAIVAIAAFVIWYVLLR